MIAREHEVVITGVEEPACNVKVRTHCGSASCLCRLIAIKEVDSPLLHQLGCGRAFFIAGWQVEAQVAVLRFIYCRC